jgi:hypothetical protein
MSTCDLWVPPDEPESALSLNPKRGPRGVVMLEREAGPPYLPAGPEFHFGPFTIDRVPLAAPLA